MKRAILALLLVVLGGCSALDQAMTGNGKISESISAYDNHRVVRMEPARVNQGLTVPEFGLYWQSDYGDRARLIARLDGIISYSPDSPLMIRVDGRELVLQPVNPYDFGDHALSSKYSPSNTTKEYWASKDQIQSIAEGKDGAYKLTLRDGYIDGKILYTGYGTMASFVGPAFREFYVTVWAE